MVAAQEVQIVCHQSSAGTRECWSRGEGVSRHRKALGSVATGCARSDQLPVDGQVQQKKETRHNPAAPLQRLLCLLGKYCFPNCLPVYPCDFNVYFSSLPYKKCALLKPMYFIHLETLNNIQKFVFCQIMINT